MTSTIFLPLVLLGIFSHSTGSALERRDVPQPGSTIIQFGGSEATYLGCYREPQNGRALTKLSFADDGMTNQACGQACQSEGFPVFGTEYSRECWCGTMIYTQTNPETECSMQCRGDNTQFCGAGGRLSVWNITRTATTPTAVISPSVPGGLYVGCISEANPRALAANSFATDVQTLELCAQRARDKNYRYFGLEYGSECWLDDIINSAATFYADDENCKMPCSGNSSQSCGGGGALSLFNNTAYAPRIPSPKPIAGSYTYQGCYADQAEARLLTGFITSQASNTVDSCLETCFSKQYIWAGVEYGQECYCGNGLSNNNPTLKADSACSLPCPADAKQNCGGNEAVQLYKFAVTQ